LPDGWRSGFRALPFWNNKVLKNTDAVVDAILSAADLFPSDRALPNPSPVTPLRGVPPSPTRAEGKKEQ
jgi:Protein of unknown function (DUF559)